MDNKHYKLFLKIKSNFCSAADQKKKKKKSLSDVEQTFYFLYTYSNNTKWHKIVEYHSQCFWKDYRGIKNVHSAIMSFLKESQRNIYML